MSDFFNDYFNIRRMLREKKEYKKQMKRVEKLPDDYRFVYKKIQATMWQFVSGAGYDMMKVQCELIDLFEQGASEGKSVLEITGEDIASFVEELSKATRTRTEDWKNNLNEEVLKHINNG